MVLLLRVDVDNAYTPIGNTSIVRKMKLILNYLNENYWAPHIEFLGYNEAFLRLINDMHERGIRASIFFKYITLPNKRTIDFLHDEGFDVGMHILTAKNYDEFLKEKKYIEKKIKTRIYGFSKHGDGLKKLSRKHAWRYEPEKYIKWGIRSGMKYFSGNKHDIITDVVLFNDFCFLPKVFYIEPYMRRIKATVEEAIDHVNSGYVVVALVHPRNCVLRDDVKRDFEKLISKADKILTLKEYVEHKLGRKNPFTLVKQGSIIERWMRNTG